jgi:hypothetical protein
MAGLNRQVEQLARLGYHPRVLAASPVADELERLAGKVHFTAPVQKIEEANLGEILAGLRGHDLVVIGSLGFELARATLDLADQNPWVRLVSQALLKKLPVILVADDLAPGTGSARDRLTARSADLLRDLAGLGLRPVPLDKLGVLTHDLAQSASTLSRAAGGLVTEADVEQLVAEGERRLVLPPQTIVTPLARSRATELGLEIVKEES